MPYLEREYLLTTREGDIFGAVRIVQSTDGLLYFHWSPGDDAPPLRILIPETMRASQFLAAWLQYLPDAGLQLTA